MLYLLTPSRFIFAEDSGDSDSESEDDDETDDDDGYRSVFETSPRVSCARDGKRYPYVWVITQPSEEEFEDVPLEAAGKTYQTKDSMPAPLTRSATASKNQSSSLEMRRRSPKSSSRIDSKLLYDFEFIVGEFERSNATKVGNLLEEIVLDFLPLQNEVSRSSLIHRL